MLVDMEAMASPHPSVLAGWLAPRLKQSDERRKSLSNCLAGHQLGHSPIISTTISKTEQSQPVSCQSLFDLSNLEQPRFYECQSKGF